MSGLRRLYLTVRQLRAARAFRRSCDVGEHVTFGPSAAISSRSSTSPSVTIGPESYIDCVLVTRGDGRISIGSHSWLGGGGTTRIGAVASVEIGECSIISNHVHIYDNNNHPTDPMVREQMSRGGFFNDAWEWTHAQSAPVVIEDNVWVGEFSAILKGVRIGRGSIVASHSVVVSDVPQYSVVAGNPARVVKSLPRRTDGPF